MGPVRGEVVSLAWDGVEAMAGAVVISAVTLVTGCLDGVKVFDSIKWLNTCLGTFERQMNYCFYFSY